MADGVKRVSVVIIADEVLNGTFHDENGPFFIEQLAALGHDLVRLVTIRDDVDEIAREVRRCADMSDLVFTTGGVGPTHDDMTPAGIAEAFELPLVLHQPTLDRMKAFGLELNPSAMQMAMLPEGTELVGPRDSFPLVKIRNVIMLPGVPKFVRRKFPMALPLLGSAVVHKRKLSGPLDELDAAPAIREIAEDFPLVKVGSYPRFGEAHTLVLTLKSHDLDELERAVSAATALGLEPVS